MSAIKILGPRYYNIVLKKADFPLTKRAGEGIEEEVDKVVSVISNPKQHKTNNLQGITKHGYIYILILFNTS